MPNKAKYIISTDSCIKEALERLNTFSIQDGLTLFVTDADDKLCGTLTDGDIRRGLLRHFNLQHSVSEIMNRSFTCIRQKGFDAKDIERIRNKGIETLPMLDEADRIIKIINLSKKQTVIPVDAIIMAGGKGERLLPLTLETPKPLLVVGNKPIIEHNIDRLKYFGIDNITITVRYLGEKIQRYFGDGSAKEINIKYLVEDQPLGTIGALSNLDDFIYDDILVMNSDLLTNIDWENFYSEFVETNADMMVATVPYSIQIPYAVLETSPSYHITSFKEKPTYVYHSNAGIYLLKKEVLKFIPKNSLYNATDLLEALISNNKKVLSYSILGYWLDIGQHADYKKANEDIKHIKL